MSSVILDLNHIDFNISGMAPGLCGLIGGRPKVSPVLRLFSFLHRKKNVPAYVTFNGIETKVLHNTDDKFQKRDPPKKLVEKIQFGPHTFKLEDLAYARSGDKGDNCNIGVIARHPAYVPYLRHHLTADVVYQYFEHLFSEDHNELPVVRYELPGIHAFNFVMRNCLDGGGVASLRIDPQGKSFAQMLLELEIENLPNLLELTS